VGIIGRNGSGKSTLLKILSRITAPTEGYAEIHGRIGSLLEVGTGFHPELTGRENIYLNGAILGMKRAEVDHRFDEIVDFAEIEKFLDTPVKRYSSGMYVRLAFAVASHLEPQVLIVDEVLAVGDVSFQRKCLGRMADVTRGGRTVLFVSHNMAAVESLCPKACLLDHGALVMYDDTPTVVKQYLTSLKSAGTRPLGQRIDRQGNGRLRFTDIMFRSADGRPADVVQCGQDVSISVAYDAHGDTLKHVRMAATVYRINGECLLMLDSQIVDADFASVPPVGRFSCLINRLPLTPGQYYLNLYCEVSGAIADWVQQAAYLTVEAGDFFGTGRLPPQSHGGMLVPHSWCVSGLDRNAGEGGAA
jgi:lipopolysaccharide transport system ATP-binding protein